MALVKGIVEGQHEKWEKYNILVNGTWYNTKLEWAKFKPVEGDEVEFDDGGRNYTKNLRILKSGGGPVASTGFAPAAPKPKGNYSLGVELGHAANVAKDMANNQWCNLRETEGSLNDGIGSEEWYKFWVTHTQKVYGVMKNLREQYESPAQAAPAVDSGPTVMTGASKPSAAIPEPVPVAEVTDADVFPS